jgi:hypothetical protein
MRTARAPRYAAIDCAQRISREQAQQIYRAGYRTVFRYVDRVASDPEHDDRWPINLTRSELYDLLSAGLRVSLVQYFSTSYESTSSGRRYSREYGRRMGEAAAANARALGIPPQVTIWNDLEGCPDATPAMVIDYCNGWSEAVLLAGYLPGLYVGSGLGSRETGYVSGEVLYGLPRYRAYWRAASIVPQVPVRGWTVVQGCQLKAFGLTLDQDLIALDHKAKSDRDRFLVVAP